MLCGCASKGADDFPKIVIDVTTLPIAIPLEVTMYEDTSPREDSGITSLVAAGGKFFTRGADNAFVVAYSLENFNYLGKIVSGNANSYYFWTGQLFGVDSISIIIPREYHNELDLVNVSTLKVDRILNMRKLPKGWQHNLTGTTDLYQTQGRWNTLRYSCGSKHCAIIQGDITDSKTTTKEKVIHDYFPEFVGNPIPLLKATSIYNRKRNLFVNVFTFNRRFDIVNCENGDIQRYQITENSKILNTNDVQYSFICGLDDSFVLHYLGYSTEEARENPNLTSWFEEWDYNGNCIGRYSVDNVLSADYKREVHTAMFCITPDRQIICWVSSSDKPIWVMKLND